MKNSKAINEHIISCKAQAESVDVENRVIKNVILAQTGEATGHGFSVENSFIDDLVSQSPTKSNFGHNYDNLGLQLGKITNVTNQQGKAVGDLAIYSNADNSPRFPGMGSWVLNQAAEDPSSLMLSIRFSAQYFYQYDSKGAETVLKTGYYGDPIVAFKEKTVYAKLGKLKSVDVVDEGALTDTMFTANDSHNFFSSIWNFFKNKEMENQGLETKAVANTVTDGGGTNDGGYVWLGGKKILCNEVQEVLNANVALTSQKSELEINLASLNAQIETLKAENNALKEQPAAQLTNGATGSTAAKQVDVELAELGKALKNTFRK